MWFGKNKITTNGSNSKTQKPKRDLFRKLRIVVIDIKYEENTKDRSYRKKKNQKSGKFFLESSSNFKSEEEASEKPSIVCVLAITEDAHLFK